MSLKFSKKYIALAIALPLWVYLGFELAQAITIGVIELLQAAKVPLGQINPSLFQVIAGGVIYAVSILIVIGMPWLALKARTTKAELGVQRSIKWADVAWVPAGVVVYFILTSLITLFAMYFLTFIDYNQQQDTGFSNLSSNLEYILAFIMLVIIAPVAEEVLFRGYLFGKLKKYIPLWISILITSIVFAIVHGAWNVGLDVFALSIVLCLLRVITGSLWPSIMLHMLKNGLAYFLLFIYPTLVSTLGG